MRIDEGAGDVLRIIWQETVTEPVTAPETSGFGTTLIRSTVEGSLDGSVRQDWSRDGLKTVIEIPFERATEMEVPALAEA